MTENSPTNVSRSTEAQVFVSYARTEIDQARKIINVIEEAGFRVWWDGLLEAGSVFTRSTEAALNNADAVVVLWSAKSVDSHWVRDEATNGRDRGRLVPISLDGSLPPLGFRQFQSIDISGWNGQADFPAIRNILYVIDQLVGGEAMLSRDPAVPLAAQGLVVPQKPGKSKLLAGAGALLVAVGLGWAALSGQFSSDAEEGDRIAILPFKNLSGDPEQAYFSDGLSEELRAVLTKNEGLQVVAQTSSNKFRDDFGDPKSIANALGVNYLLGGSVRRSGETVRVSAQLINAKTGVDDWSETYDRKLSDIFTVQSDIADRVASALAVQMAKEDPEGKARPGGTTNAAAYDAYLRGRALYDLALDQASDRAAEGQFKAAIAADPGYGAAWSAVSRVQTTIANSYPSDIPLSVQYDKAVASAREAVKLAPQMADGHAALGYVLLNGRLDARGAGAAYRQSYRYGGGNADIIQGYANFMARIGKLPEAQRAIAAAIKLDPLNPAAFRIKATVLFLAGDYSAARSAIKQAFLLNPEMSGLHRLLGQMAYLEGNYTLAKSEFLKEGSKLSQLQGLAMTLPKLGDRAGGAAAMARLRSEFGDNGLYQQAEVLAQAGQTEAAMAALERAFAAGDSGLVQALNDPLLAPLSNSPRYQALLNRIGFKPS